MTIPRLSELDTNMYFLPLARSLSTHTYIMAWIIPIYGNTTIDYIHIWSCDRAIISLEPVHTYTSYACRPPMCALWAVIHALGKKPVRGNHIRHTHIWQYIIVYVYIWQADHIRCPYMASTCPDHMASTCHMAHIASTCPRVSSMHYTHIWQCDNVVYPYMVMRQGLSKVLLPTSAAYRSPCPGGAHSRLGLGAQLT